MTLEGTIQRTPQESIDLLAQRVRNAVSFASELNGDLYMRRRELSLAITKLEEALLWLSAITYQKETTT